MTKNWATCIAAVLLMAASVAIAEEGVTDTTLLIGQTVSMTGQVAGAVKELNKGANAYVAMVNKRGGVHGRKIVVRTMDDKFDPRLAAALLFNVRAKYQDEVTKAVEHFTTVGINKIGIAHVDDSFGGDGLEGFLSAMESRKLTPAAVVAFDRVKPDFPAAVKQILDADVRALESIRGEDFGGLIINYGPDDHTGSEFVELTMIGRDGRFVR